MNDQSTAPVAEERDVPVEKLRSVGQYLRRQAKNRWLTPEELFILLTGNPEEFGFHWAVPAAVVPGNGLLYFYNTKIQSFKYQDGINWIKKRDSERLQETYQNIRINGEAMMLGTYIRSADGDGQQHLHRRIYRLKVPLGRCGRIPVPHYFIVHYRQAGGADEHRYTKITLNEVVKEVFAMIYTSTIGNNSNQLLQQQLNIKSEPKEQQQQHSQQVSTISMPAPAQRQIQRNFAATSLPTHQKEPNEAHCVDLVENDVGDIGQDIIDDLCDWAEEENTFTTTNSTGSVINHQMMIISDFSPCEDLSLHGEVKVLVCLKNELTRHEQTMQLYVAFVPIQEFSLENSIMVPAEIISRSVLRCHTPQKTEFTVSQVCNICICDHQQRQMSAVAEETFTLMGHHSPAAKSLVSTTPPHHVNSGLMPAPATAHEHHEATLLGKRGKVVPELPLCSMGGINSPLIHDHVSNSIASLGSAADSEKQHKIRIVERLNNVKSAIPNATRDINSIDAKQTGYYSFGHEAGDLATTSTNLQYSTSLLGRQSAPPLHVGGTHSFDVDGMMEQMEEWLDDHQLASLSTAELEVKMERYIMAVVRQLVQLAVLDDDLKAEIDALDASGFSLLHYCCLYNLNSLIPVLLARGADANKRSSSGSTALHIAAGTGHLAVVQVLVESNADVNALDQLGMLPSAIALQRGYLEVASFLQMIEKQPGSNALSGHVLSTPSKPSIFPLSLDGTSSYSDFTPASLAATATPGSGDLHSLPNGQERITAVDEGSFQRQSFAASSSSQSPTKGASGATGSHMNGGGNALMEVPLSSKLLHQAFASLSLTDKCALSLSLSNNTSSNGVYPLTHATSMSSIGSNQNITSSSVAGGIASTGHGGGTVASLHGDAESSLNSPRDSISANFGNNDDYSEIQSVLSETDKTSLELAMSMMDQNEKFKVENEVRTIQNNVRTWLLRKNYTNLRDSARVLQVAWRERKRKNIKTNAISKSNSLKLSTVDENRPSTDSRCSDTSALMDVQDAGISFTLSTGLQHDKNFDRSLGAKISQDVGIGFQQHARIDSLSVAPHFIQPETDVQTAANVGSMVNDGSNAMNIANIAAKANVAAAVGLIGEDCHQEIHSNLQAAVDNSQSDDAQSGTARAAARLQAATRGMIARKAFDSIRKQTMASLVIQRFAMNTLRGIKQFQQVEDTMTEGSSSSVSGMM